MSRLSNKYASRSSYQMIINFLESDGVVCNFNNKVYDEIATYAGGVGYRKLFTALNDKINFYHEILSYLTGEQRANIYESIPAIDFLNLKNTSLTHTFLKTNDPNNPIDNTVIVNQPHENDRTALELIEENDQFTINRAVTGYNTAEHFYNTTGTAGSAMNIQVSTCTGEHDFIYKGVLIRKYIDDSDSFGLFDMNYNMDLVNTNILCYKVINNEGGELSLIPSPDYEQVETHKEIQVSNNSKYWIDLYGGAIILNTIINHTDGFETFIVDGLNPDGVIVNSEDYNSKITLHVCKNDIVVLVPQTTYTSFPNRMLLFKSYPDEAPTVVTAYQFTWTTDSHIDINLVSQTASKQNMSCYYYQAEENALYTYDSITDLYSKVNATVTNKVETESGVWSVTTTGLGVTYKLFSLLFDRYNSDFNATFQLTNVNIDDSVPDYLTKDFLLQKLNKYISIEKEYYAPASGLMDGLFCEPKTVNESGEFSVVTKWKFCNDVDKASKNNTTIDIGTKYNQGHLLYRGNILASPLKLTDSSESTHPGKATAFYNKLFKNEADSAIIDMFRSYMSPVAVWNADNSNTKKINSLINKYDYSNVTGSTPTEVRLLSGRNDGNISKVKYVNKLCSTGSTLEVADIDNYITAYSRKFRGNTLYINSEDSDVVATHSAEQRKRVWINNNTTAVGEKDNTVYDKLLNQRDISFYFEYTRIYKKNSTTEIDSYSGLRVRSINPMELFVKEGEDPDTILVYPEFATKYPETMYLMSKSNLNLKEHGATFLYNNGKFLAFTVEAVFDFSVDKIATVRLLHDSDDIVMMPSLAKFMGFGDILPKPCYIYRLTPLSLSFTNEIKIYDWNNNQISLGSEFNTNKIIGASYPEDYFKVVTSYAGAVPVYNLVSPDIIGDMNVLRNSSIISNLPTLNTLPAMPALINSLSSSSVAKRFVNSFKEFITTSSAIKKLSKGVLLNLLAKWPVSDSATNPLTLKEVSDFLKNLENFADFSTKIANSSFRIVSDGQAITITEDHFKKLKARINDTSSYVFADPTLTVKDIPSVEDMRATGLDAKTLIDNWLFDSSNKPFTVTVPTGIPQKRRQTFTKIRKVLNDFFGDGDVTEDSCRELDDIFGNNTEPFVAIGESFSGNNVSSTLRTMSSQIALAIQQLTYNACVAQSNYNSTEENNTNLLNTISNYYADREGDLRHLDITATDDVWSGYKFTISIPTCTVKGDTVSLAYVHDSQNPNLYDSLDTAHGGCGRINATKSNYLIDISILEGLADFIKTSLEGTNTSGTLNDKYVTCVADDIVKGRPNSLYYKRYNILNSRMNKLTGPLYKAGMFLKNVSIFDKVNNIDTNNQNTYKDAVVVMPVAEMEPMTYLPPQQATANTIELDGKFYSDKEMEALRNQIGSSCILTCTVCSVKDSCPFYNEEEVIKMYCTGLEYIDFWVKDNELELLDKDSFKLELVGEGTGFDMGEFDTKHLPYSDIMKYIDSDQTVTEYKLNELNKVRNILKSNSERSNINLNYNKYVHDDLGWLLGGRYGTVEKNKIKDLDNDNYSNIKDYIHDFRYLYDALFIDIENKDSNVDKSIPVAENDSYVDYKVSSHEYDVFFEVGLAGNKTKYSGKTKIKIPRTLKLFKEARRTDDVYLVSDDKTDREGLEIKPVIYLGKVGDIKLSFDLTDDGIPVGVTNEKDTRTYAADVAQWCANYYKGCLAEDPLGYSGDQYKDRDQYWMETVYKKINGRWCPFPGRRRMDSGYMEPVADQNTLDEPSTISGHPVVNNYINFLRRASIRMYDPEGETEKDRWLIPFVNSKMALPWPDKSFEDNVEIQRKVLTLMKTNLRLVVVKQYNY